MTILYGKTIGLSQVPVREEVALLPVGEIFCFVMRQNVDGPWINRMIGFDWPWWVRTYRHEGNGIATDLRVSQNAYSRNGAIRVANKSLRAFHRAKHGH